MKKEDVKCPYKDKCTDCPNKCDECVHNTGKKSYYERKKKYPDKYSWFPTPSPWEPKWIVTTADTIGDSLKRRTRIC